MECVEISFSGHAAQRMFERRIGAEEVLGVVTDGELIASYPDDLPLPSILLLGFANNRPLHVVLAVDGTSGTCVIITVYVPDLALWETNFKMRKRS